MSRRVKPWSAQTEELLFGNPWRGEAFESRLIDASFIDGKFFRVSTKCGYRSMRRRCIMGMPEGAGTHPPCRGAVAGERTSEELGEAGFRPLKPGDGRGTDNDLVLPKQVF